MKVIKLMSLNIITLSVSQAIADDGITTAVPEPSNIILLGFAIAALGFYLYWRSKKKKL